MDVIISGGTKGIGAYISEHLRNQFEVLALYKSDTKNAEEFSKTFNIEIFQCDITKKRDINNLSAHIDNKWNEAKPTILINNAGVNKDALLWKMTDDEWDLVIDTTLKGAANLTRMMLPYMNSQHVGRIINISSVVSQLGVKGTVNYAAAKAGLIGFTKSLVKETAYKNITVNNLALGYFDTGIIDSVPVEDIQKIIKTIPVGRLGNKEDIANAIDFLIHSNYVTGQTININGGLT